MFTPQEKAQCVSWFIETKLDVQTQRRYRTKYGKPPPSRSSIRRWHKKVMETGSVLDAVRSSSSSEICGSMLSANSFRFSCHLVEVSVTFALRKHTIVTFCVEPWAML